MSKQTYTGGYSEITTKHCTGQGMDQQLPFTKNFNKLHLIIEKRPNLEKFKESLKKKKKKPKQMRVCRGGINRDRERTI